MIHVTNFQNVAQIRFIAKVRYRLYNARTLRTNAAKRSVIRKTTFQKELAAITFIVIFIWSAYNLFYFR